MSRETKAAPSATTGAQGISNRESPQDEAQARAAHPPIQESPPAAEDASGNTTEPSFDPAPDEQTSRKAGSRSAAQKAAGTRHQDRPMPATQKVGGAFGREGDRRED